MFQVQKSLKIALQINKISLEVQKMSVKSNYFKLSKEEFDLYLQNLKSQNDTLFLLDNKYFFYHDENISSLIFNLKNKVIEFDNLINSLTSFSKKQIIQSYLIKEIEATNKIESINSTRHDIFKIITKVSESKEKDIISISNGYSYLLQNNGSRINNLSDIRNLYDNILKDCINKNDLPDGKYFRKDNVFISNGLTSIHQGINGEDNINKYMNEFIKLYNSNLEVFTKMILSHFLFEEIHPFYDGNGRLGRFLFSNGIYFETRSIISFLISYSLKQEKSKYYKALKSPNEYYSFNCLNEYFEDIINILINQITILTDELKHNKELLTSNISKNKLTKSEEKIFILILESSIYSTFGLSNEEIMLETGLSKRTIIYSLNKFKQEYKMIDTKIGKFTYHKFELK